MDTELLKKRISFAVKLTKYAYKYFNSKLNMKQIQATYHADKGRITRIDLLDIDLSIFFRIKDGKFEILKKTNNPDNIIQAPSDLYFSMFEKPYDELLRETMTRWRFGELSFAGSSAMVDFKLFIQAVKDLKDSLPRPHEQAQPQQAQQV